MSLLMDALRKAEEAKRVAAQTDSNPTANISGVGTSRASLTHNDNAAELSLEPMPATDNALSAAVVSVAATKPRPSPNLPPEKGKPAEQAQRSSAQNIFTAKNPANKSNDRLFTLALAGVAGLAVIGIGAYVWWQMQPRGGVGAMPALTTPSHPMPPIQSTATLPPAPATPLASLPLTEDRATQAALPNSPLFAPAATPEARPFAPARSAERPQASSPIRVTHQSSRVNPLLEQGYNALQQGNLGQAEQAYARMLATDPKNLDALYGLAAIAVSRQQNGLAENYYLRILEVDPRDALAHAGLTSLNGRAGGNAESRLKSLIAEQPNVAALHFALGNIYAQDQRWRDAQQAYFLAYKNDSEAPDIVFNLAISLDQLHQNKLAAQYYTEALRLTTTHPGTFNRNQAQSRLRELQAAAP